MYLDFIKLSILVLFLIKYNSNSVGFINDILSLVILTAVVGQLAHQVLEHCKPGREGEVEEES